MEKPQYTAAILIRITPEQRDLLHEAAERATLSMSNWMRSRLVAAARAELHEWHAMEGTRR